MNIPRIVVAGLRGGGGKTFVSVGLTAALRKRHLRVAPFKKGPDYIDAAWLAQAAELPCRNLDLFLMARETIGRSFAAATQDADFAVIEGNRGLFDGLDAAGSCSTAELAKLLDSPVLLVVDCTKSTRTVAAAVLGCQQLAPDLSFSGVVLNQTAGARHESVIRQAVEHICELPVLGAIPRIAEPLFPERHLGLVPPEEHDAVSGTIERLAALAEQHLDVSAISGKGVRSLFRAAKKAPDPFSSSASVRIGVFRDAAFQFYYQDNLDALAAAGAELLEVSPLDDAELPEVDALYIGGGFPETLAPALSANRPFLQSVRGPIEAGLPVYAECGGSVYLGRELDFRQNTYPMAGVLPVAFAFQEKPQGHGYVVLETERENPFYPVGQTVRGHEFHYTYMRSAMADDLAFAFRVQRGHGFGGQRDGLCYRNVLACYTHIHALGTESWAPSLIRAAQRFRSRPETVRPPSG